MAAAGMFGLLVYGVWIPAALFRRLEKESQDEGEQRFDPDFMESHGWLVGEPSAPSHLAAESARAWSI